MKKIKKECFGEIKKINESLISKMMHKKELFIKDAILKNASPPIKGEITKCKLKYRCIKIISQQIEGINYTWVEQKGEKISSKFFYNQAPTVEKNPAKPL